MATLPSLKIVSEYIKEMLPVKLLYAEVIYRLDEQKQQQYNYYEALRNVWC